MARYRVSCPNSGCYCTGPMEGDPSGGYVKQHFADVNRKKRGGGEGYEQLLLRCPKCNHRWRTRTNMVDPW